MKNLQSSKNFIWKILLGMILILLGSCMSEQAVMAQEKARYTIKQYKEIKSYRKINTIYIFDKPILKGESAAIRKINKSLEKEYKKSLESKKTLQDTAKGVSKYTAEWKSPLYSTDKCKVTYNQGGIVSFRYYSEWYAGGVHNSYYNGLSYDLKTGRKLRLDDVVSGSTLQIKTKIWKKYEKKHPNLFTKKQVMETPLSDWHFYLKKGKVIISDEEATITLQGKY